MRPLYPEGDTPNFYTILLNYSLPFVTSLLVIMEDPLEHYKRVYIIITSESLPNIAALLFFFYLYIFLCCCSQIT